MCSWPSADEVVHGEAGALLLVVVDAVDDGRPQAAADGHEGDGGRAGLDGGPWQPRADEDDAVDPQLEERLQRVGLGGRPDAGPS